MALRGHLDWLAETYARPAELSIASGYFNPEGFWLLADHLELNLGRYDPTPVRQVRQWFDDLWEEAVPLDLAAIYQQRFEEYQPYLTDLRVLWELFGTELEEEQGRDPIIRLTNFQNDGLWRANRILREFNGVLFADGVGLGKTFVAGELIRGAVQDRRQRVLLVTPAALRDGMWNRFRNAGRRPAPRTIQNPDELASAARRSAARPAARVVRPRALLATAERDGARCLSDARAARRCGPWPPGTQIPHRGGS